MIINYNLYGSVKMKKKKIIIIVGLLLIIGIIITFVLLNRKYPYEDENTLYYIEYDNEILRFERIDYSLGQNQVVSVQKSINKGKKFENITDKAITLSMEPKFVFLNKKLGFAISKSNLTKNNNYSGIKVTQDGGKSFVDGKINYDNSNIEILTVEDVPYYDNNKLKLHCSIYHKSSDS